MSSSEIACTYVCLILNDDGLPITAEKIAAVLKAANVMEESYWPSLFAKLAAVRNIEDLILNAGTGGSGGAPVAVAATFATADDAASKPEEKEKEETKDEESDEEAMFSLFD